MRVERESKIIAMTKVGSSCGPSGQQVEKHFEFAFLTVLKKAPHKLET